MNYKERLMSARRHLLILNRSYHKCTSEIWILFNFTLQEYFGKNGSETCRNWPDNYFAKNESPDQPLINEMFEYGNENLALVHILIQSPYVTKIKRDVAISLTNYVANAGGLMGLWLGFSFISILEIIYWCCSSCQRYSAKVMNFDEKLSERKTQKMLVKETERSGIIFSSGSINDNYRHASNIPNGYA